MDLLIVWKLLVSVIAVVGLSLVAEHVSARVAGVLSGYPLGSAIALFFIGIEQGNAFAAEAAEHTLAGFSASLVLVYCYYRFSKPLQRWHLPVAALAGVLGFLLAAAVLQCLPLSLVVGGLITGAAIMLFNRLFAEIDNAQLGQRVRFSHGVLLFRALMAAATVLLITGIAELIGPAWSGLLSAFPITLFPFMLILHYSYGQAVVYTVIKNYPMGLGALLCYTLTVALLYRDWGVAWGTAGGFVVATVYLWGLYRWMNRRSHGE